MAEYYPLLVRAVAALPNATPDARRKIYERARQALIGQLRKIDPPVPEADIEREGRALDDAVAKLEAELKAKAGAAGAAAEPAAAPPPPAPSNAAKSLAAKAQFEPMTSPLGGAPSVRPAEVQAPVAPPKPPRPLPPFVPTRPAPGFPADGAEGARRRPPGPAAPPPVAPVQREPGRGPNLPPPVHAPEPKAAPPSAAATSEWQPAIEPPFSERDRPGSSEAEPAPSPSRTKADWRSFGRPRHDKAAKPGEAAVVTGGASAGASPPAEPAKSAQGRGEAVRPAAPQPEAPRRGFSRHWIVGSVVAVVVIVIAGLAILLKDNPEELARRAHLAAPPPEAGQAAGKIVDRVGSAPAQSDGTPAAASAVAQAPQPGTDTSQQAGGVIPVAQRAALLVQAPDQPQKVMTYVGTVVWRRENVNHGQDQPLSLAVRADIDLPEAKLKATMIFQKNTDPTLPASHTVEVRFTLADGSPIPGVKQIDVPQLRKEDAPAGDPLTGVPAPITQNYFLIGLTQGDAAVTRNIDLIKSRQWFDIPLLLSDDKVAKLTFEKGDPGDRAINDALAAWQ
jgi:hypothetical protein